MPRGKVMEILDLSSFNVHYFADASSSGVTYHIENGHVLTVALDPSDYDSLLRYAKFDGELWPKGPGTIRKPKKSVPAPAPQQ